MDIESSPRKGILISSLHGSHVVPFFAWNQLAGDEHSAGSAQAVLVQKGAGYEVDQHMDRWQIGMCALALIFLKFVPYSDAHAERDWAVTLYSGRMTDANLTKTATLNFEFEDAYLIDLGLSRRLYTFQNYFDIEIEGQIAKYFGDQDNWEFNLVAYFRWLLFPWDAYLDTSFAVGAGLSYATSVPAIEAKNYEDTAQFLGALMFEFAFSLPHVPQWSLVTGIHHRSGAGGVFSGVDGASNAWVIGIRYSF